MNAKPKTDTVSAPRPATFCSAVSRASDQTLRNTTTTASGATRPSVSSSFRGSNENDAQRRRSTGEKYFSTIGSRRGTSTRGRGAGLGRSTGTLRVDGRPGFVAAFVSEGAERGTSVSSGLPGLESDGFVDAGSEAEGGGLLAT